jgi:hypothetical protein
MGVVKNVYLNVCPHTFPIELVVTHRPHDPFCPIIFWRTFLNVVEAVTDCKRLYLLPLMLLHGDAWAIVLVPNDIAKVFVCPSSKEPLLLRDGLMERSQTPIMILYMA